MNCKYDASGRKVNVMQQLDNGEWLVCKVRQLKDGQEFIDEYSLRIVKRVFECPPKHIYESRINLLKKKISRLGKEVEAIRKSVIEKV